MGGGREGGGIGGGRGGEEGEGRKCGIIGRSLQAFKFLQLVLTIKVII